MSTRGSRFAEFLTPEAEEAEGRELTTGKHAQVAVQFEWEAEGGGALYGFFLGCPHYDAGGIEFVFESAVRKAGVWVWDDWVATITFAPGTPIGEIYALWCHLTDHTQRRVKVGAVVKEVRVERAKIIGRAANDEPAS